MFDFLEEKRQINIKISNMENKIRDFENKIENKKNFSDRRSIINIEKDILKLLIRINEYSLKYNINFDNEKNRLIKIKNSLNLISKYAEYIIDARTTLSLNLIALINLLFLPITVIVGYYGMNFNSMYKKGPFKTKQGERWVMTIIFISILLSFFVIYFFFPQVFERMKNKSNNSKN